MMILFHNIYKSYSMIDDDNISLETGMKQIKLTYLYLALYFMTIFI
jgi:hypothetical protein